MDQKIDPVLKNILKQERKEPIPVIVQIIDKLNDEDKNLVRTVGGKFKDDLYIINSYSADLSVNAISSLVLSPRVKMIYFDSEVRAI